MQFFNTIAAILPLVGCALAQSTGSITVHVVTVSTRGPNNTLTFSPQNVQAQPGEMVQFQFQNGNHSVVQSTFAQPCIPINNVMSNVTGFFSGFNAVPQPPQMIPTYTVMVNNTKPVWYYCAQAKHCQKGMVGAINAATTGDKTVAAFAQLAAQAPESLVPGQSNGTSTGSGTTSPGSASTTVGSTTMATTASSGSSSTATTSAGSAPTGAASGSLFASSQQVLAGGFAAALLSAVLL